MHVPISMECVAVVVWWMANTMSYRTVAQQFSLAWSTVAGIVVEVTHAITERLLDRVVYLRNPDRVMRVMSLMVWVEWDAPGRGRPSRETDRWTVAATE
ncbi:UNVERIFIED_CONTAM: hypothetical protein K2H54_067258 [Gekko kuhli]